MANKKITVREYDRRAEELIRRIRAEAKPFEDDSHEGKEARRKRARKDFLWFCQTYLPHHFDEDFSKHDRKLAANIHHWNRIIEVMAFRGWGKSTKIVTGYGLYATLFELQRYLPCISDTDDQAMDLAMPVKVELEENPRIQQDFGKLISHNWAEDEFETTTGIRWKCFSWVSMKLGRKYKQHRPGIAFVDDLENDKNVKNPEQVKQRLDFVLNTLVPGMAKRWQIWYITTRLGRYCVAGELEKNPEVIKFILAAEDEKGRPTEPERFPVQRLQEIRKLIGTVAYAKNYLLKILSDETRAFQDQWFKMIPRAEEKYRRIISFIDPSVGAGQGNDFKAIISVGWTGEFYDVLHAWIRKSSIDHMIRATYTRYEELRPLQIGLETNNFQVLLKREYQRAAREFGYQLPIKPVVQKENKIIRIERLSPLVENGLIRFVEGAGDINLLIDQLLDFPDGNNDDGPDALEGAIRLLEKAGGSGETRVEVF